MSERKNLTAHYHGYGAITDSDPSTPATPWNEPCVAQGGVSDSVKSATVPGVLSGLPITAGMWLEVLNSLVMIVSLILLLRKKSHVICHGKSEYHALCLQQCFLFMLPAPTYTHETDLLEPMNAHANSAAIRQASEGRYTVILYYTIILRWFYIT